MIELSNIVLYAIALAGMCLLLKLRNPSRSFWLLLMITYAYVLCIGIVVWAVYVIWFV